jgi:hypothetical protein
MKRIDRLNLIHYRSTNYCGRILTVAMDSQNAVTTRGNLGGDAVDAPVLLWRINPSATTNVLDLFRVF